MFPKLIVKNYFQSLAPIISRWSQSQCEKKFTKMRISQQLLGAVQDFEFFLRENWWPVNLSINKMKYTTYLFLLLKHLQQNKSKLESVTVK